MCYTGLVTSDTLLRLRKKLGLTQNELAQLVGVTGTSINRWENGRVAPADGSLDLLQALQSAVRKDAEGVRHLLTRKQKRGALLRDLFVLAYGAAA